MIKLIELIKLMPSNGKIQVLDNNTWEDYIYGEKNKIINEYSHNNNVRETLSHLIPVRVYGNSIYVYKLSNPPIGVPRNEEKTETMQVEVMYTDGAKAIIENVTEVKYGMAIDLLFAYEIIEHKLLPSSVVVFIQKANNEPSEIINLKYIDIIKTKIGQQ